MVQDYITAKIASMVGGLFGGAAILTFIKPKTVGEAFMRGGMSAGTATVFSIPMAEWIGLSNTWESQLMCGFVVGFIAYSVLGMVANFFIKNQDRDIVDAVKEIKEIVETVKEIKK
jgi:hypothetical protein